jgi:orotate phosphoribosyltransferase
MKDFKDLEGAHFGCNYLAMPGSICNKCGTYVNRAVDSEAEESGMIQRGHFELTSGRHSDTYVDKFAALTWPEFTESISRDMAKPFRDSGITLVIGPALGGVLLAHGVAKELSARCAFVEREGDSFQLKRFSIHPGDKILLVDDVLTTGFSVRQMLEALKDYKAQIYGLSLMMDRSVGSNGKVVEVDVPVRHHVFSMWIRTYEPQDCPQCHGPHPTLAIRKGSRQPKLTYEWHDNTETTDYHCSLCPINSKWDVDARIDYNNQGGPHSAHIEVSLYPAKSKSPDGMGHRMTPNENWFILDMGRGGLEELKKTCEEFYEKNLKDQELSTELLQRLHKSLSVKV